MDYALWNAIRYWNSLLLLVMLFYDVVCQYHVKLMQRMAEGKFLGLPDGTKIHYGIGVWHIHGHQKSCYCRFSPLFIEGAGNIDGELIETLWAPLNEAAGTLRSMSTAHRQETLDVLMNDSNWKKLIRICGHTDITSPPVF